MSKKRLFAGVIASTLTIAQMAMPVMAADTGTFNVDLTTKTGVLRVQVPTTLAVAVDQFELTDVGTQISSADFEMVNKSEMDVKVKVDSIATVDSGTTLKGTVAEVEAATNTDAFAWLGAAAMTAEDTYHGASESFADLNEKSANVAAFDATSKTATQEFYLKKATGNKSYKVIVPAGGSKNGNVSYAQFYELTADSTVSGASGDADKQAALNTLIAAQDIYVASAAVTDGATVSLVEKGTSHTYDSGEVYYTVAATATAGASLADGTSYVYAEMAGTDGGAAGFRYIGKLSDTKSEWTKTDISRIAITYTITGLTASNYKEAEALCTYGLYKEPVEVLTTDGKNDIVILYTGTKPATVTLEPKDIAGSNKAAMTAASNQVTITDLSVILSKDWMNALIGASTRGKGTYTVKFGTVEKEITLR